MRPSRHTIRQAIRRLMEDEGLIGDGVTLSVIRALEWAAGMPCETTEQCWVDVYLGESPEDVTEEEEEGDE